MGLVCIGLWAAVISGIYFFLLWAVGVLRVDIGSEIVGYDFMDFSEIDFHKKHLEV